MRTERTRAGGGGYTHTHHIACDAATEHTCIHMTQGTCHTSHVTCHMSHVTRHKSHEAATYHTCIAYTCHASHDAMRTFCHDDAILGSET